MHGSIALGSSTEYLAIKDTDRVVTVAAGTPLALVNTEYVCLLLVQALPANTQNVAVGTSDMDMTPGSEKFIASLEPGQTLTLPMRTGVQLFLDSEVTGEGVVVTRFA